MQKDVLSSTKFILDSASEVSINQAAIENFCASFHPEVASGIGLGQRAKELSIEQLIGLTCVFNCVNFYFWAKKDEIKWTIQINGQEMDGAAAMFCALERSLLQGEPLLDANFLSQITRMELGEILHGNTEIPFLNERVACLQEAGRVLLQKFDGNFMHVFEAANNDAIQLTDLFIQNFPSFDDHVFIDDRKIEFHKRAQLNADMINYRLVMSGKDELENSDQLTAFADYKIPQILRRLGIIQYSSSLAEKIDSYIEIEPSSMEEIEIRSATIWAVENIKTTLLANGTSTTSKQIDDYLWNLSQTKIPNEKPYHRTKTIFY